MFLKLTFSRYHISQCSESLLSHWNYHNLNYQELKLIHIQLCEWQKMSSPTPVIEHIFGLSAHYFGLPCPGSSTLSASSSGWARAPQSPRETGAWSRSWAALRVIRPGTRPERSITRRAAAHLMRVCRPDISPHTSLTSSLSAHFTTLSGNMRS